MRVVQHDAGATRSNDLARRCDEMTTAFRFANASGQVHHGVFSKGGQSKSLSGSGLKLPHRATDFTKLDGGSPTPNVEGRGRGHRLAQLRPSKLSRNRTGEGQRQHLGVRDMRLTLGSPAPGSKFTILSWFPLRVPIGVGYREGAHVEAGFP